MARKSTLKNLTNTQDTVEQEILETQSELQEVEKEQVPIEEKVAPKQIKPQTKSQPKVKKQIDLNQLVACYSTRPNLFYKNARTQEEFEWTDYNDEQYLTVNELTSMKSSQKRFFQDGWLIVDDAEVVEYLGLSKLYGSILEVDDLDAFFNKSIDGMKKILNNVPNGFKKTVGNHARKMIEEGTLDSRQKIKMLEEVLDIDLLMFAE